MKHRTLELPTTAYVRGALDSFVYHKARRVAVQLREYLVQRGKGIVDHLPGDDGGRGEAGRFVIDRLVIEAGPGSVDEAHRVVRRRYRVDCPNLLNQDAPVTGDAVTNARVSKISLEVATVCASRNSSLSRHSTQSFEARPIA
jgi:hypothetical protein